jgi:hypothetical protein
MNMTIDEKYDNAIQMFRGYYDGKNERLRITSLVLRENGFSTDFHGEFVSMICRRLGREGILKGNPFTFLPNSKEIINQEKYNRLYSQWEGVMSALMASSDSDRYNPQYGFGPSPAATKKLAEKEDLEKEMASLERIFTFVIDGKKLEAAYKKRRFADDEKKSDADVKIEEEGRKLIKKNSAISVRLKSGLLKFNKKTGFTKLNNIETTFHPSGQECKVLAILSSDEDYRATFAELLGQEKATKESEKRKLTFVIRNLKKALGILPKRKAKNKDIIKSVKGVGYRLVT